MQEQTCLSRISGARVYLGLLAVVLLLAACAPLPAAQSAPAASDATTSSGRTASDPAAVHAGVAVAPAVVAPAAPPAAPAPVVKAMKLAPEKGSSASQFVINSDGLTPGKRVELIWDTAEGSYVTKALPETVEFYEKQFTEKKLSLGWATTDAQGHLSATLNVPDDYGEVHDVYAVMDGQTVARGGYRIMRNITVSPQQGPVGTPITIKATGLGYKAYESTLAIRYDNNFMGIVSAVTTGGTATFQIRAAGRVGKHVIDVDHGAKSVAYLNNQQSGTAHIPDWRFEFTITDDKALPSTRLDWPDKAYLNMAGDTVIRTTSTQTEKTPGYAARIEPAAGPILSKATLKASGLKATDQVELYWMSAKGNRVSPSGWSLTEDLMTAATPDRDGSFKADIQIPDDLGGWHMVKVVQGDKVLGETPFFVQRSLVSVPQRVKAGDVFTIQMKGVGWTELDNGVAVTYDNSAIGFACGFNSNGDVTMNLTATGGPGIHLIDLYPMLYQGHGKPPWGYQVPLLSFAQDAPGLALGYNLPVLRLAIEVVE